MKDDINHLHMNWKLRYSNDGIILSLLLPYLRRGFENKNSTQENNQIEIAHFLSKFISTKETIKYEDNLSDPLILLESPYNLLINQLEDLQLDIPKMIDNRIFLSIQNNALIKCNSDIETDDIRNRLMQFGDTIKNLQHYCYHTKIVGLTKLLGKLLTRIWWIYHNSNLNLY